MPNFTKEQQLAIDKDGTNIIVSAGAGSGKTAVLTERVIRKLKDGVPINKLLVLTFTKEAAKEMKDRIRTKIKKDPSLKEALDEIDSSYITTFDSFTFSILKKYHYALNMPKNISIVESSIIDLKRKEFLDQIFDDLYEEENENFLKLIKDFVVKNDKELKKNILKLNNGLELRIDKEEYLNTYIDKFYNDDYVNSLINDYLSKILSLKDEIVGIYEIVTSFEKDKVCLSYEEALKPLISSNSYEDIKRNLDFKLPRIVEDKESKEKIKYIKDTLKKMTIYENEDEIKSLYKESSIYVKEIIDIINKLDTMINLYKKENNSYEFIDISKMAINIIKENDDIREELKSFYNEIMVDEYQDTNDLQELFVSLISNNNVYMVGDIKQSIYRFRNANPDIFKDKYELYENEEQGYKIDLNKNFRSRKEVLDNINVIFDKIMDSFLGGADYKKSHRMVFGLEKYLDQKDKMASSDVDFYNYKLEDKTYSKEEVEAFIIADDIKNKIDSKYQVFDKDTEELRNSKYSDFCIIMDRGTSFDLYKKVFEYIGIPLSIYRDEELTTAYDTLIIKNLIKFIIKIKNKDFDTEFKYLFMSIARSYLFEYSDDEIFTSITNDTIFGTDIYKSAEEISKKIDDLTINSFVDEVLTKFNFYQSITKTIDISSIIIRVLYIKKMCTSLESLGFTIYDLEQFLDDMIDSENEIKYKLNTDSEGVKIMNIHKSKGLEFPICYFSGLYKTFNISDMKDKFVYDKKYGLITPYFKEGIGLLPSKILSDEEYLKEEVSEKIRLFYVALTRAREKMIFVAPLNEEIYNEDDFISANKRLKYKSFLDIVNDVKDDFNGRIKDINYKKLVTKDYNINKDIDLSVIDKTDTIPIKNIEIEYNIKEEKRYSKESISLLTKEEKDRMIKGTALHLEFENDDFLNPTSEYVKRFLKHDEFKNIKNSNIYKEYEFIHETDDQNYHGIIDLMIEYDDHIDIIDYKTYNIDDPSYIKQLEGYKNFIEQKTNKRVNIYLYSIERDELREILSSFYLNKICKTKAIILFKNLYWYII